MKYIWKHINQFNVEFDESVDESLKSFKEEVIDHILQVTNKKDVILLFSGGNDSRFVARTLMEINVPFRAITTCFKQDFTDYDSIVSQQFCLSNHIEQERIYVNRRNFFEEVKHLALHKRMVYPALVCYYIQTVIEKERNAGFDGVFLTGCGSEFKIGSVYKVCDDIKLFLRHHPYILMENNLGVLYNFTTDRTFFSYIRNEHFIQNYKTSKDGFDIRDKIYQDCYPDLKLEKKTPAEDLYLQEYYDDKIVPYLKHLNPYPFITDYYTFDLVDYYKRKNIV
jgi:hypothetical protein